MAKRRAASRDSDLATSDFDVPAFIAKIEKFAPTWVAFHGKAAAVEVSRTQGSGRSVALGAQAWTVGSSRVFVLPSASAANRNTANLEGKPSRLDWFRAFARLVPQG